MMGEGSEQHGISSDRSSNIKAKLEQQTLNKTGRTPLTRPVDNLAQFNQIMNATQN